MIDTVPTIWNYVPVYKLSPRFSHTKIRNSLNSHNQETNTRDDTTSSVGIGGIMKDSSSRPIFIEVEEQHDTASRLNNDSTNLYYFYIDKEVIES